MGWSFAQGQTRAALVEELDRGMLTEKYTVQRGAWGGGCYWQAVKVNDTGAVFIVCNLVKREDGALGVKSMSEAAGPSYYACPLSLLALATEPAPGMYAAEWRERVREHHAKRQATATLAAGAVVNYAGHSYRLDAPAGPRKGWIVTRVSDGRAFRMPFRQLADATPAQ